MSWGAVAPIAAAAGKLGHAQQHDATDCGQHPDRVPEHAQIARSGLLSTA